MSVQWEIIEDEHTLLRIADEWRLLHNDSMRPEPFQSIEFVLAWLRANPTSAQPLIILGRSEQGTLIAAWPLMVRHEAFVGIPQRTLVPMGSPLIDYSDPILSDERYADGLVRQLLIIGSDRADVIVIDQHRRGSAVSQALQAHGFKTVTAVACHSRNLSLIPTTDLGPSEIVIGDTSRRTMKGKLNRLHRIGEVAFTYASSAGEASEMLDLLFDYHVSRWASTNTPSMFENPVYQGWYRELAKLGVTTGAVMIGRLTVGDTCVGVHFGLRSGNTLIWTTPSMNSDLSKLSPGLLLAYYTIKTARAFGIDVVDFSRGGEDYKRQFCDIIEWNDTSSIALSITARVLLWLRSKVRTLFGDSHPLRRFLVRTSH